MKKLADISAFERLQGSVSIQPLSVFNTSYETVTSGIYDDMTRRSSLYWDEWRKLEEKVNALYDIYNELEEDGVFAERPKLQAPLGTTIDNYQSDLQKYADRNILEEWKQRCFYGMFWKRMRGEELSSASIATDLPDDLLRSMRRDLIDATDNYIGQFNSGIAEMKKSIQAIDKRITRYQKIIDNLN